MSKNLPQKFLEVRSTRKRLMARWKTHFSLKWNFVNKLKLETLMLNILPTHNPGSVLDKLFRAFPSASLST